MARHYTWPECWLCACAQSGLCACVRKTAQTGLGKMWRLVSDVSIMFQTLPLCSVQYWFVTNTVKTCDILFNHLHACKKERWRGDAKCDSCRRFSHRSFQIRLSLFHSSNSKPLIFVALLQFLLSFCYNCCSCPHVCHVADVATKNLTENSLNKIQWINDLRVFQINQVFINYISNLTQFAGSDLWRTGYPLNPYNSVFITSRFALFYNI